MAAKLQGAQTLDQPGSSAAASPAGTWQRVAARLQRELGETAYRSWIRPLAARTGSAGQPELAAPTRFMRDWVQTHYLDRIRDLWAGEAGPGAAGPELVVCPDTAGQPGPVGADTGGAAVTDSESPSPAPAAQARPAGGEAGDLEAISGRLDPRFTFANFVVGKPNELAHAAARRVADSDEVPFNPLFLYGGVGLGKTHLMHAIAQHIRQTKPEKRIVYLSAEKFMYQFIQALRYKDTVAFKQQFRSVDVLMIDDVHFIAGKDSTQEEFFHTFNALVDNHRQVVISADKSPSDLEGIEERLKSRMSWGLVADIHPTSYELRLGILQAKADKLGAAVPTKVLEFLAHRITANVRELEGALNRIVAHAELVGRPITIETAQELLADLLRANDRRLTIDEIQRKVADHYNIKMADMYSTRRARAVARPRQVAMFLAKQLTERSLPEIGRKFGGRDHTTVMHAVTKIDELRTKDREFSEDLELLRRSLTS